MQMAADFQNALDSPSRTRRVSSETTLSNGGDAQILSSYRWRTTWTAPSQDWSPDVTSFNDHIDSKFYCTGQTLQQEIPSPLSQSSIWLQDDSHWRNDEESQRPGNEPHRAVELPPAPQSSPVGFFSPSLAPRRRTVFLHYFKIRRFHPTLQQFQTI